MPKGIIAYNPAAGRYPSHLLAERAASVLRHNSWTITLEYTYGGKHITELARNAARSGHDAFFMAGGDGSINYALSGLLGTETALAVLPAGTANVWAKEQGLPGLTWTRLMALEESARRLADGRVREVDIGFCNNIPFILWAGIGLDAYIVHRIEPRLRWEKHFAALHYAASAIWYARYWQGMNIEVVVDGNIVCGHFLLALVNNIHLYAGGLAELSPNARLDDGVMDFWLFEGRTLADTVQLALDLWSGKHTESDQVHRYDFRSLVISSDQDVCIQLDGEPIDTSSEVNIRVVSNALRVLVPEDLPQPLFTTAAI